MYMDKHIKRYQELIQGYKQSKIYTCQFRWSIHTALICSRQTHVVQSSLYQEINKGGVGCWFIAIYFLSIF